MERGLHKVQRHIIEPWRTVAIARLDAGWKIGGRINKLATLMRLQSAPKIVIFYPGRSLAGQMEAWSERHGGQQLQVSRERSLAGIRRRIRRVDFVVIDATDDPAQASDAFFQIYKALGSESMAVYTEVIHDGLEILVRRLGVSLLLGPMAVFEWDGLFAHKFPRIIPLSAVQGAAAEQAPNEEKPVTESYPFRSIAG
jgi:hypothetical protein